VIQEGIKIPTMFPAKMTHRTVDIYPEDAILTETEGA
jgi:hypothetical protein